MKSPEDLSYREQWERERLHEIKKHGSRPRLFNHPLREQIDIAIREGQSVLEMSIRFNVSRNWFRPYMERVKLREHSDIHNALKELADMEMNPEQISKNLPANRVYGGFDMIDEIMGLRDKAQELMAKAETAGDTGFAISALREQLRIFQTAVKMVESAQKRGEFNPWVHPDIISYQEGLLEILQKHPKALEAVIEYTEKTGKS